MRRIFNKIRSIWKFYFAVNWIKTIYFNFKKFPFHIAKKLPIFFYGSVKFSNISGEIILDVPEIKKGMIGFGQKFELPTRSKRIAELSVVGKLVFKGNAHIGIDCFVHVGEGAYCEFGYMSCLGSNVKLICKEEVILSDWVGIGYESQLTDSNFHPMMNTETGEYYPMTNPVHLAKYNAFSNRISIMPGTKTPENCVIASNSVVNKDYRDLGNNILIGGVPAKLIKKNYNRDWEGEKEMLKKFKIIW